MLIQSKTEENAEQFKKCKQTVADAVDKVEAQQKVVQAVEDIAKQVDEIVESCKK